MSTKHQLRFKFDHVLRNTMRFAEALEVHSHGIYVDKVNPIFELKPIDKGLCVQYGNRVVDITFLDDKINIGMFATAERQNGIQMDLEYVYIDLDLVDVTQNWLLLEKFSLQPFDEDML